MTREEFDIEFDKIDIVEGSSMGYACTQLDEVVDAYVASLEARIAELQAPKLCDNCIHMEQQGNGYYVCNDTEFQSRTTPDTECFLGFKTKDSE